MALPPRRFRKGALYLALMALAMALTGEGALRLLHAWRPSFVFASADYNRFRGAPGAANYGDVLNSGGFNDRERAPLPAPGVRRVLCLGDSFVFGVVPRDATFTAVAEAALAASALAPIELVNFGIPGTGPREYLALLEHEGLATAPHLALTFVFLGNDFFEFEEPAWWRRSLLVELVRYLAKIAPAYRGSVIHGPARYVDDRPTLTRDAYLDMQRARSAVFDPRFEAYPRQLRMVTGSLEAMAARAASIGARFAVVILPDETQVDAELRRAVPALDPPRAKTDFDFERPNRDLARFLAEREIPVLDLVETFRTVGSERALYRPQDSHFNLAGNQLAGRALAVWLEAEAGRLFAAPLAR